MHNFFEKNMQFLPKKESLTILASSIPLKENLEFFVQNCQFWKLFSRFFVGKPPFYSFQITAMPIIV